IQATPNCLRSQAPANLTALGALVFIAGFFMSGSQTSMSPLAATFYPTVGRATGDARRGSLRSHPWDVHGRRSAQFGLEASNSLWAFWRCPRQSLLSLSR